MSCWSSRSLTPPSLMTATARCPPTPEPAADPRHRVLDLPAVSQDKRPVLFGHDAETFEHVARDPRVRGAGIHESLHRLETLAGPVTHLYGDPKVTHPRICSI